MASKGEDTRTLGEYVRARRHALNMTLQEAADRSKVDRSYWSRLETGEYQTPNPRFLVAMARALDLVEIAVADPVDRTLQPGPHVERRARRAGRGEISVTLHAQSLI